MVLLCAAGGWLLTAVAEAKGPVDKITIAGADGSEPVEITEGEGLGEFNPWGQLFLGERLDAAPAMAAPATVTMYLKEESGKLAPVYRFRYVTDAGGGYVQVPGRGDVDYELNKTTIITENDGKWFRASAGWVAFVAEASRVRPPATGDGGLR